MDLFAPRHLLIILAIVLVVFGTKKLKNIASDLGGAVRGGEMYGRYPTLVRAGPDDAYTAGRWIPTTSVEQYGATLARWFGVSDAALAGVFPNLTRFPSNDLGFLS